jgi:hypothetical protein
MSQIQSGFTTKSSKRDLILSLTVAVRQVPALAAAAAAASHSVTLTPAVVMAAVMAPPEGAGAPTGYGGSRARAGHALQPSLAPLAGRPCRGRGAELTRGGCLRRADSDAGQGRSGLGGAGPEGGAAGLLRLRKFRSPTWHCRKHRGEGSHVAPRTRPYRTAVGALGRDQHVTAGESLARGPASLGLDAETRRERRRHACSDRDP